jgi:cytochrome c-type biogenesis protein CcmF
MRTVGQLCLLAAFVGSGYAAFACIVGARRPGRGLRLSGILAGVGSVAAVGVVVLVLARALVRKDFSFEYVAQYSSRLLSPEYSLSALWVGQAGSLLLWAWLLGILALAYRFWPGRGPSPLRDPAFGVLSLYLCFLVAILVFAADPMQASIDDPDEGAGLSPLLQHPSMLVHPPIVFLGYAGWTIPFAVLGAALLRGSLESGWIDEARPWALFSWAVLGTGILLGADWAYEELGWGGYWGWDPVENGSLVPWLTGTALIHTMMAWRYRGVLKRSATALAIATFALCNFATFLTRSGVFSSVHAFSQSPIGWMFLVFMLVLAAGGGALIWVRRKSLAAERRIGSLWARESLVMVSAILLVLIACAATGGTLTAAVSNVLVGRAIVVGPAFYNNVLIPTGLVLLAGTAAAPALRWGKGPTVPQRRVLLGAAVFGAAMAAVGLAAGQRHPIALAVAFLASASGAILGGTLLLDALRHERSRPWMGVLEALRINRRQYVGFLVHLGFVALAIGIAGSALGTRRHEAELSEGESIAWAGRTIHYVGLVQRTLPDKLVAEAVLEVSRPGKAPVTLRPAKHLHLLQNEWTTEVAIHSDWGSDFYTILGSGEGGGRVSLTFVENPLMRWIWVGGAIMVAGALFALWPAGMRSGARAASDALSVPQTTQVTAHSATLERLPARPVVPRRRRRRRSRGEPTHA